MTGANGEGSEPRWRKDELRQSCLHGLRGERHEIEESLHVHPGLIVVRASEVDEMRRCL